MPTAEWTRLGERLVRRRIELDPRYVNRQLFVDERGLNYRIVSDLERGRRDNYEDATITSAEVAYAIKPGGIRQFVAGGELEPLAGPARASAASRDPGAPADIEDPRDDAAARLFPGDTRHDRIIRNIWRLGEFGTSREDRLDMIEVVDPGLAAALRDVGGRQSEAGLSAAVQVHVQSRVHGNESDTLGVSGHHRTLFVRDD